MDRRYALGNKTVVLIEGDIVRQDAEAIANAANGGLLGGGGVDGAIHRAAGPDLLQACREAKKSLPGGRLPTGQALLTPGFMLRAKYVIHCVGPVYASEGPRAPELLASCYRNAMRICGELAIRSIAFPSISTGVYGYPLEEAAPIALRVVRAALEQQEFPLEARFVLWGTPSWEAFEAAAAVVLKAEAHQ
jgi:O-acetyl-ADP-ribose deacetylase (regulator of RNase III)